MDLLKAIDRVAEILNSSDIKEIKIKDGGSSIFMTKNNTAATSVISAPVASNITPVASAPVANSNPMSSISTVTTTSAVEETLNGEEVKSPMVGTFYGSPSPDAAVYVKEGQQVKKGDVLCIIEAMKIMNKIEAEKAGKIVKILAKDGDPVQYDQPLFIIE
ncbi:acetyl-CoA carboxylase biotin carboxyl carrier protein [Allofrancisella guangzhouensis]|uniref:Biotin carboxyl carrier protein of acetyl-CoA carboxylase n=1 Tax=Allofrancisella guangzhouensis TaxID=594679 RepID=A0A0A8E5U4_9GAMM|nr:acetyl-CoA carboxylase biotin carboxyl carrier protein [Allofrancisella guangzhouensis]AJC49388.1 acetyl-CoA carboxylase [Allofrancisella guangzhouensis]MBK2026885.1 acetyl-CoA carboxylase biotin carboxyl carrier protein [Allofrancisella guangzhouensis]MBK2044605.1 acetyl-CoA carboxylase biotin carboxyl carrier protein [Allofrancisella guangzhouensis]MBK2045383.1 acetyl-CoA carboxylase biotin carboxyl carrier protein [Allofrancisella guangzhouensis]